MDEQHISRLREMEFAKLAAMLDYAGSSCRRRYLVTYFGEEPGYQRCGRCDACLEQAPVSGARARLDPGQRKAVMAVLSCVRELGGGYTPNMVAKVLSGSQESKLRAMGLHRLPSYGRLSSYSVPRVISLIEAVTASGLVGHEYTRRRIGDTERDYRVLVLRPGAVSALETGQLPEIRFPGTIFRSRPATGPTPSGGGPRAASSPASPRPASFSRDLLEYLKDIRLQLARGDDVPAYVVAPNRTLEEIAATRPTARREMLRVHGMGPHRFERYGKPLLDAVKAWTGTHRGPA